MSSGPTDSLSTPVADFEINPQCGLHIRHDHGDLWLSWDETCQLTEFLNQHRKDGKPMKRPLWQLHYDLGPGPYHYIQLYCGMDAVARFNQQRGPWHPDDQKALERLCEYLNQRETQ